MDWAYNFPGLLLIYIPKLSLIKLPVEGGRCQQGNNSQLVHSQQGVALGLLKIVWIRRNGDKMRSLCLLCKFAGGN